MANKKTSKVNKKRYMEMLVNGHKFWRTSTIDYGNFGSEIITTILIYLDLDDDSFLSIEFHKEENELYAIVYNDFNEFEVIEPIKFADLTKELKVWIKKKDFVKQFEKLIGGKDGKRFKIKK